MSHSTGKERDAETGLDYFGFRYHSAAQGRFTSPDPANFGAHIPNPQSWNGYSYALNSPLRFVDPLGLDARDGCYAQVNGVDADCGQANNMVNSGAAVVVPDFLGRIGYSEKSKSFYMFTAYADGGLAYTRLSAETHGYEWGGQFLTDKQFYNIQRTNPNYKKQFDLAVQELMEFAGQSYSYGQIAGWINQGGYSEVGAPFMGGGNWNFTFMEGAPDKLVELVTPDKNKRVRGWNSLHLHDTGYFHVDTASGDLHSASGLFLWFMHGVADLFGGNTIYGNMGMPR
jgi:RHS repeat-associated protein